MQQAVNIIEDHGIDPGIVDAPIIEDAASGVGFSAGSQRGNASSNAQELNVVLSKNNDDMDGAAARGLMEKLKES